MRENEETFLDGAQSFSALTLEIAKPARTGSSQAEELAQHLASWLRSTDVVGATGPDRVTAILPFTDADHARQLADRLARAEATTGTECQYTVELHASEALDGSIAARSEAAPASIDRDPTRLPRGVHLDPVGVPRLLCVDLPRGKRLMDVLIASLGLILLVPVMLPIALVIKVLYGGPVIFKQWRTGRGFRRFQIYKFRTMQANEGEQQENKGWSAVRHLNEVDGPVFKSSGDPRILPFGKLLRKASLDELPQFLNVLKGDMTLIGPRALSPVPDEYETWQLRRFDLTPGIACYWQAENRKGSSFDDWMRSDLRYVDRGYSLSEDLRLLFSVLKSVVRCSGSR